MKRLYRSVKAWQHWQCYNDHALLLRFMVKLHSWHLSLLQTSIDGYRGVSLFAASSHEQLCPPHGHLLDTHCVPVQDALCILYTIFDLDVIALLYMTYANGCQPTHTFLPRLRPSPQDPACNQAAYLLTSETRYMQRLMPWLTGVVGLLASKAAAHQVVGQAYKQIKSVAPDVPGMPFMLNTSAPCK